MKRKSFNAAQLRRVRRGLWDFALIGLLLSSGLLTGTARAAEQARPIRIGALTPSWGPTPATVGLQDGLQELGYRENEDFVLGVRFTQGDEAALPAAARQLVQSGVDLLFTETEDATQAAQQATSQIPIVFVYVDNPGSNRTNGGKVSQEFAKLLRKQQFPPFSRSHF